MNSLRHIKPIRWGVIVFYLLTILMSYLSQALPFNGQTNGEVSDQYSTLITPADYAFSIWGLIYLALGAYVFFQAFWADPATKIYNRIGGWLIIAFLATSGWLPVFQYEMIAFSVLVMMVILGALVQVVIMLTQDDTLPKRTKAILSIPFGLYLGWISVATLVNISVLAKYGGWYLLGVSEANWLLIMIVVGFVLAVVITLATGNLAYSLVFVWAYVAIAVRHYDENALMQFSLGAAIVLLIVALGLLLKQYQQKRVMLSR